MESVQRCNMFGMIQVNLDELRVELREDPAAALQRIRGQEYNMFSHDCAHIFRFLCS